MRRFAHFTLIGAVVVCAACAAPAPAARPHPTPDPSALPSTSPTTGPDVPADLLNPDVTQATITRTICVPGWTATIRPPAAYTGALKRRQLAAAGWPDRNPAHYEEDHQIPLELGGHPRNPANLWPELRVQFGGHAEDKDRAENAGKKAVCAGRQTLALAQATMYHDWPTR
jgi:hypothetical protein